MLRTKENNHLSSLKAYSFAGQNSFAAGSVSSRFGAFVVCCCCLAVLLDLGGQVELEVTHLLVVGVLDGVLDHEGHVLREAEGHGAREGGRLGEEVEVAKSEGQRDRLVEVDDGLLILLGISGRRGLDVDVAAAHVAGDRELDAILASGDDD